MREQSIQSRDAATLTTQPIVGKPCVVSLEGYKLKHAHTDICEKQSSLRRD